MLVVQNGIYIICMVQMVRLRVLNRVRLMSVISIMLLIGKCEQRLCLIQLFGQFLLQMCRVFWFFVLVLYSFVFVCRMVNRFLCIGLCGFLMVLYLVWCLWWIVVYLCVFIFVVNYNQKWKKCCSVGCRLSVWWVEQ